MPKTSTYTVTLTGIAPILFHRWSVRQLPGGAWAVSQLTGTGANMRIRRFGIYPAEREARQIQAFLNTPSAQRMGKPYSTRRALQ